MIQIDMQMPTNCLDCPACNEYLTCAIPVNGRKWGENDVREFGQSRPGWCPLKEQEAVTYKRNVNEHGQVISCGNCGAWFIVQYQKYCHECGFPVLWEGR